MEAIKNFPVPKNIHQIRQFLGLIGHFRKCVPRFAQKSKPLSKLLKKAKKREWTDEQQRSYDCLKEFMTIPPILTIFDSQKQTILYTDASRIGIAEI